MSHILRSFAALAALAVTSLAVPAHAGIDSCGNIDVSASAQCTASGGVECKGQCSSVSFEAACAGKLEAECETTCTDLPTVECTGSCQGTCEADCTAQGAEFSCEGSCTADCDGTCDAHCSAAANQAECKASCHASCTSQCQGSCTGTQPSVECKGKCEASCKGSCTADANMKCQTDCAATGYVDCTAQLQSDCNIQCDAEGGAVFCDGQYVDRGNNAKECIDALNAWLKEHVTIEASASGSSSCDNGTCEAKGDAQASCKCTTPGKKTDTNTGAVALVGFLGLAIAARRRYAKR